MDGQVAQILDIALRLPDIDRAEIAEKLIASLEEADPPEEVEAAWQEEIARRLRQIGSGEPTCIPWERVRAKMVGLPFNRAGP